MKKTALVLSGGGFKGAFQVGALKYLKENWSKLETDQPKMKFDIVAGVSVGSLNGLLIALDKFDELVALWDLIAENGVEEIYTSDFIKTQVNQLDPDPKLHFNLSWPAIKRHFPETTRNIFLKAIFNRPSIMKSLEKEFKDFKSIADNTPLKNKLEKIAKRSDINNCIYRCGYVSLNDGKYHSIKCSDFKSDEDFVNGILASTSMPIIWSPIETINTNQSNDPSKYTVDGGVRNVSPLGDVINEISEQNSNEEYTIIIINCSSGKIHRENYQEKNIAQIALRSLVDIAISEIFTNDLKEFIDKNYILEQIKRKYPTEVVYDYDFEKDTQGHPLKYFNAIIIKPDDQILGDTLTANKYQIEKRIDHGFDKAKAALDRHFANPQRLKFTIS